MDTYDVVIATYVYNFINYADWEEVKDREALKILREVAEASANFINNSEWKKMLKALSSAERKLKAHRNRTKDRKIRDILNIWIVLILVLTAVALSHLGRYEEALKTVEQAQRLAHRTKYVEPYIVSAALSLALKFRLGKDIDSTTFQALSLTVEEPYLRALALEVLAYVMCDVSSDAAFFFTVLYWDTVKDMEGFDLLVYMERLYRLVDTIILRLMYEMRSGKVLPEEVDWPEETKDFFDWVERGSENEMMDTAMLNLYVKLLHYAALRSEGLKEDPFNVEERLQRASKKLRETIETLLSALRDDEDEGKGNVLKA